MVSVERIQEYCDLEPEASLESEEGKKPANEWPEEGKINMDNLSLTYGGQGAPKVLDGVTCNIGKAEKVCCLVYCTVARVCVRDSVPLEKVQGVFGHCN